MTEAASSSRPTDAPSPRWTLAVAILGSTMAFLDGTVVNVALPVMQRELAMTVDVAQWVVEAYALLLAALVLVGGALGDRYGRRKIFTLGAASFGVASVACAAAPSAELLVIARAVQGVAAAMLVPGSLALVSAAYGEKTRGAAIGTWSALTSMTAAIGPVAGGWVVERGPGAWRWLFLFNVPFAIAVVVLSRLRVVETLDDTAAKSMDWLGASLATLGLGAIVFGLVDTRHGPTATWLYVVGGLVVLGLFVVAEAREKHPMVPLALFRSRTFAGTNALTLLLYAALGGAFFFLPFDLIQVEGYAPSTAGASLLPFVFLMAGMSRWAGGLTARRGPRLPLVLGPLGAAVGFALLAMPLGRGSYFIEVFPGVVALGVGMGLTVAPLTTAVMGSVDAHHGGVASGVNNAVSRAASVLAVAALGAVLVARFNADLDRRLAAIALDERLRALVDAERPKLGAITLPPEVPPATRAAIEAAFRGAFASGFRTLMLVAAALAVLSSIVAAISIARRDAQATA